VDGGLEVDGGLDVAELGDGDVTGGWEVLAGVVVDDIRGGVDEGVGEGAGGEGDGTIEFGEVAGGNTEVDAGMTNGDGVGTWLVGVEGGLEKKKKRDKEIR
jgi:hypothetical protein